jgi:peptide deformylase
MAENATEQPELDTEVTDAEALDAPDAETAAEVEHEELDPEVAARRAAALAHVRKFGDPVLRTRSRPVDRFDDALRDEVERMSRLMIDSIGVGLAANQVGVLHRLLVYRVQQQSPVAALVNPEIEWVGDELETFEEGCLSLPAVHVDVERPVHIRVRAQNEFGESLVIEASGLEARVIQHEIDHLDGVLVLDRIGRGPRKEAMRALRAALESA